MNARRLEVVYAEYVVAPGLERHALLAGVRGRFQGSPTVLYPGCSVHVTPSCYFQHVVYVDRSDFARDFFSDPDAVLNHVGRCKRYRPRPFIRFLAADYTGPLPLPEASFDLLLSLYAVGVTRACARFVRPGGLLVTNDHAGDAGDALANPEFTLVGVGQERRGQVHFSADRLETYVRPESVGDPATAVKADVYIFRKRPLRRRPGGPHPVTQA